MTNHGDAIVGRWAAASIVPNFSARVERMSKSHSAVFPTVASRATIFCNLSNVAGDAVAAVAKDQAVFQQTMEETKAAPVSTPTIAQLLKGGEEQFATYRTALEAAAHKVRLWSSSPKNCSPPWICSPAGMRRR